MSETACTESLVALVNSALEVPVWEHLIESRITESLMLAICARFDPRRAAFSVCRTPDLSARLGGLSVMTATPSLCARALLTGRFAASAGPQGIYLAAG
jgi:hypothetical protein